jgi:hypothetical protein
MLWIKSRCKVMALVFMAMVTGSASVPVLADEDTFEMAGVIESVNLVNRTLVLDGRELNVSESLMVDVDGRRELFLRVIGPEAVVSVSGVGQGAAARITSAFIHELPPVQR